VIGRLTSPTVRPLVTKVKHRPVSRIAHDSPADPVQRHRADP